MPFADMSLARQHARYCQMGQKLRYFSRPPQNLWNDACQNDE